MNSIVVYRILFLSFFLVLASGLWAQKPAIDLISSNQQHMHAEATGDTACLVNPPVREGFLTPAPPVQNQKSSYKEDQKKRRQIRPSLDSLFQKEESRSSSRTLSPAESSLFKPRFHPLRFIFFITALNQNQ